VPAAGLGGLAVGRTTGTDAESRLLGGESQVRDSRGNWQDGALDRARLLEAVGLLHTTLQGPLGTGFMSAVKVLS